MKLSIAQCVNTQYSEEWLLYRFSLCTKLQLSFVSFHLEPFSHRYVVVSPVSIFPSLYSLIWVFSTRAGNTVRQRNRASSSVALKCYSTGKNNIYLQRCLTVFRRNFILLIQTLPVWWNVFKILFQFLSCTHGIRVDRRTNRSGFIACERGGLNFLPLAFSGESFSPNSARS